MKAAASAVLTHERRAKTICAQAEQRKRRGDSYAILEEEVLVGETFAGYTVCVCAEERDFLPYGQRMTDARRDVKAGHWAVFRSDSG